MNPYHILKVSFNATDKQIRAAYRHLALLYHPDKNPDCPEANEHFQNVQNAFEMIETAEKRAAYQASQTTSFTRSSYRFRPDTSVDKRYLSDPSCEIRSKFASIIEDSKTKVQKARFADEMTQCAPEEDEQSSVRDLQEVKHFNMKPKTFAPQPSVESLTPTQPRKTAKFFAEFNFLNCSSEARISTDNLEMDALRF